MTPADSVGITPAARHSALNIVGDFAQESWGKFIWHLSILTNFGEDVYTWLFVMYRLSDV